MKSLVLMLALSFSAVNFASAAAPEACQLKVDGKILWTGVATDENGQGFYAAVSQLSQKTGTCLYAKIDKVQNSGRVYNNGALVASPSGQKKGLSNSQAREAIMQAGLFCSTVSCIPLQYNDKPQYEQPVQVPTYPSSQSAE